MKVSLLLLAALGAAPAMASTVNIRSCNDGDTCRTTAGERIRLACIDAPESGRAGSYAATLALRGIPRPLLKGKSCLFYFCLSND